MTNQNLKTKFKKGEVLYFKYPSRYSRSKVPGTIEAIIKIKDIDSDGFRRNSDYFYVISIIKVITSKRDHWSSYNEGSFGVQSLEIDTYCRRLTPAESVLYG